MQQSEFEKLLADTLAAHGRSPRTQETYTSMLRLFARYVGRAYVEKTLDRCSIREPPPRSGLVQHLVSDGIVGYQ